MTRRWNISLGAGFLLVVIGLVSYIPVFALFPITRDFPWVNLMLMAAGAVLLGHGLKRAFKQPDLYRGKIFGSLMAALSLAGIGFFAFGLFYMAKQLPPASSAPRVGQQAPDFTLPDQNGQGVTLAQLLAAGPSGAAGAKAAGALLIFYRGHW